MYDVSADYLAAFKNPVHQKKIRGTIGNIAFTEDNILEGSLHISNQCSESKDIKLGSVNIGTLNVTFLHNLSGLKQSLKGKQIYIEEGLLTAQGYEYVPIGYFTITSAPEWSQEGVSVEAYDNMRLLDKSCVITDFSASLPYDLVSFLCEKVGIRLANASFDGFCNANMVMYLTEQGDIETYRDLLYWICQAMCCFATVNRDGELELRRFVAEPVDTVTPYDRFDNFTIADNATRYTGLLLSITEDGTVEYYAAETDDGTTITLGENPILQRVGRRDYLQNMIAEIGQITYVPFSATMLDGAHYDLGDVIVEAGGLGEGNRCMIMYVDEAYNNTFEMKGFGADPELASAHSKSDKNIKGLINTTTKNEFREYVYTNTTKIDIGNNEEKTIVTMRLASNTATRAAIHIEINLSSEAVVSADTIDVEGGDEELLIPAKVSVADIFTAVSEHTTKGIVRYLINSEEALRHPEEAWLDGKHVLHLMYILPLEANLIIPFDVRMKASGGSLTIDKGDLLFYASGRGLVGDGKWDGTIKAEDEVTDFDLVQIIFEEIGESITIDTQTPVAISVSDLASEFSLVNVVFDGANDAVTINLYVGKFGLITEDEEIFITEDADVMVTEYDE